MPPETTRKYGVQILTVDPSTKTIEGAGKGGQLIRVSVITTPIAFRWPVVGEAWMVRQENGTWYLDSPWPQDGPSPPVMITNVAPGDAVINSPTGTIHVLGSSDGSTDFTITKPAPPRHGPQLTLSGALQVKLIHHSHGVNIVTL